MKKKIVIEGVENGRRVESRVLEEKIQKAVNAGFRQIEVQAFGQHGIGGRLWKAGDEKISLKITGQSGQRVGSFGFPNTEIEVLGPASDDVGWLNAGATIIVYGNATNGVCNAMAQGKVYIDGSIGSRAMTMTKNNPRFNPPELWVLGSVGDYFGEFMAGGVAVVCGIDAHNSDNILGYRPLVGMVGGKVFFRGKTKEFSKADAKITEIDDNDWKWLKSGIKEYLKKIKKDSLSEKLLRREKWKLITAKTPEERQSKSLESLSLYRKEVWDKELGRGGLVGDLNNIDTSLIPVIATGNLRRNIPVWENEKYKAPCEASCPTGIPVQKRWALIREGLIDDAINLALCHTPFPATICGYLCPNLCMQGCTKTAGPLNVPKNPVDISILGKASENADLPHFEKPRKEKVAIIGGGVAGISAAWQLVQKGFNVTIFDKEKELGGKLVRNIPSSRIPETVLKKELKRVSEIISYQQKEFDKESFEELKNDSDYIIIATGASSPIKLPIEGKEKALTSLDFLEQAKKNQIKLKNKLVIIGAGNVGCDIATEGYRVGAKDITLIDIQKPLAFGAERKAAEEIGAKFKYPCFTKKIDEKGVTLKGGEFIPADTVVMSIGDVPELDFISDKIKKERGFILTDKEFRTSEKQIFAIGDVVAPGLLTDAVGAGKIAADSIIREKTGTGILNKKEVIDIKRISLEYFNTKYKQDTKEIDFCAQECSSCGTCRDCSLCVEVCPQGAISRRETKTSFEYVVDGELCIGCSFCAGACPCGVWNVIPNPEEID